MVKLCFALGLVKRSKNLLNKESSCFCFDLWIFVVGWSLMIESYFGDSLSPVVCLWSEIKTTVFFIAGFSALRRHSNN